MGEPDFKVIAEVTNEQDAISLVSKLQPDVFIIGTNSDWNVVKMVKQTQQASQAKIVVWSIDVYELETLYILSSGIKGFVLKDSASEIVCAVREVAKGNPYFSLALSQKIERHKRIFRMLSKAAIPALPSRAATAPRI
jgi:DNA-binding NarL/FixJ family response regulator